MDTQSILITVIPIVVTLVTLGVINWERVLKLTNDFILAILNKTPTPIDNTLYMLFTSELHKYVQSSQFQQHWSDITTLVSDGKVTIDDIEKIKAIFVNEISKELIGIGITVYDNDGKELLGQLIVDYTEYVKDEINQSQGWLNRIGVSWALGVSKTWMMFRMNSVVNKFRSRKIIMILEPMEIM
jgi:hypothetical protein